MFGHTGIFPQCKSKLLQGHARSVLPSPIKRLVLYYSLVIQSAKTSFESCNVPFCVCLVCLYVAPRYAHCSSRDMTLVIIAQMTSLLSVDKIGKSINLTKEFKRKISISYCFVSYCVLMAIRYIKAFQQR